jgi:hypothetical protein
MLLSNSLRELIASVTMVSMFNAKRELLILRQRFTRKDRRRESLVNLKRETD